MKAIVHQPVLAAAMLGAVVFAATQPHPAVSSEDESYAAMQLAQQDSGQSSIIPPSMVYRIALDYVPGCTVLKVSLDHASKMYAVKLKSGNEVRKLLVDARTGQVVGD